MKTETKVYYRVRPQDLGFSAEDFNTLGEALERCNRRNEVTISDDEQLRLYKGDNCIIQKVTTIIEEITF